MDLQLNFQESYNIQETFQIQLNSTSHKNEIEKLTLVILSLLNTSWRTL